MQHLTEREQEILHLIGQHLNCDQIAARLGIAVNTVRVHRAHLCEKLDCHNTARLTAYAVRDYIEVHQTRQSGRPVNPLTAREREVIIALASGLTSKEIARHLGYISHRTIEKHREHAMRKLGVNNLASLIQIACLIQAAE